MNYIEFCNCNMYKEKICTRLRNYFKNLNYIAKYYLLESRSFYVKLKVNSLKQLSFVNESIKKGDIYPPKRNKFN